ncbi:phage tail tube protein [Novosphingobium humi]|uniref:Phage tail tube protein n=1 Tax=Novosphingobium humi TaxID=2282397 RepID=A0ABY7U249_9SPHN|nr:phage tail tube protein [Novosphingobium humi]WCT78670.1 phage tail tube protein [Novosphingobium humi]
MSAIAGTLSITIDGTNYAVSGSGTYLVSSSNRETLTGQDGVHGYKEMPQAGHIAWTGRDSNAFKIADLNAADGVTVVAVLANGKVIIAKNAWRDGEPAEVNTEDGTFSIRFASASVKEQ